MVGMVSLERTSDDLNKDKSYGTIMPMSDRPVYPYGMCFSLGEEEIEKLKIDCDCGAGDEIVMRVRFKVTDVGERDTMDGPKRRLELQAVAVKVLGEDGMPDGDADDKKKSRYKGSDA